MPWCFICVFVCVRILFCVCVHFVLCVCAFGGRASHRAHLPSILQLGTAQRTWPRRPACGSREQRSRRRRHRDDPEQQAAAVSVLAARALRSIKSHTSTSSTAMLSKGSGQRSALCRPKQSVELVRAVAEGIRGGGGGGGGRGAGMKQLLLQLLPALKARRRDPPSAAAGRGCQGSPSRLACGQPRLRRRSMRSRPENPRPA